MTSSARNAGGTCPTCRHDPVQNTIDATRPVAVEPAIDATIDATQVRSSDVEVPSEEPVWPWDSDSSDVVSMEREGAPAAEAAGSAELAEAPHDSTVCHIGDGRHSAHDSSGRGRNSSSATADESSVLVWSP